MGESFVEEIFTKLLDEKLQEIVNNNIDILSGHEVENNSGNYFTQVIGHVKKYFENKIVERDNVIKELRTRIQHLELKVELSEIKIKYQEMLIDNNEQYARRSMLILKGVDIKNTIFNGIDKLKLEIEDIEVGRAHRTGSKYKNNDGKLQ